MERNNSYVFRVNASYSVGFGHLIRCSALAEAINENGGKIIFATNYPNGIKKTIKCFKYEILDLSNFSPFSQEELKFLLNSLKKFSSPKAFIVDSYDVTPEYLSEIKNEFPEMLLIAIDDLADKIYPVDILINGNVYAEQLDYSKQKALGTKLLLGPKYLLLRKEFQKCSFHKMKDKAEDILVTFGGSDIANMTEEVLNVLMSIGLNGIRIHVILGHGFKKGIQKNFKENKNICFYYDLSAKQLKELMEKADIAISAGGSTLYELASCGVPTIAVKVADNQVLLVNKLVGRGIVIGLDPDNKNFGKELAKDIMFLINDKDRRREMADKATNLANGKGTQQIAGTIYKFINRERR